MTIHLTKDQAKLVSLSIEHYRQKLRQEMADGKIAKSVVERIEPDLFQLELLETWFDRQRELES